MARIIVKTDKFAKRIIKNGEEYKRKTLFRLGFAARNELRNIVRKRKKTSEPGKAPNDHGTYRRTALFSVDGKKGIVAGFADFKSNKKNLVLGSNLAQDTLEFGGNITQLKVFKDKRKNAEKETFYIKPRPHVFIARERLFNGNTKNARYFRRSQQELIDRGYLK